MAACGISKNALKEESKTNESSAPAAQVAKTAKAKKMTKAQCADEVRRILNEQKKPKMEIDHLLRKYKKNPKELLDKVRGKYCKKEVVKDERPSIAGLPKATTLRSWVQKR